MTLIAALLVVQGSGFLIEMTTEPEGPAGDDRAIDDVQNDATDSAVSPDGPASTPDDPTASSADQGVLDDADGLEGLTIRSVHYPDGPTRCTMFPDDLTGMARLETWLSADKSVFVDLEEWR